MPTHSMKKSAILMLVLLVVLFSAAGCEGQPKKQWYATCYSDEVIAYEGAVYIEQVRGYTEVETGRQLFVNDLDCVFLEIK